ncbi:MAG: hypothetical protein ACK5O2_07325 [Microthrixaceae bacterium]
MPLEGTAGFDQGVLDIPDLPPTFQFRVGNLLPSEVTFTFTGTFTGPGYEHRYTSAVTSG